MRNHQLQHYFFFGLLLLNVVVAYFIYRPFLGSLIVGVTFAVIFYPVYQLLSRIIFGQQTLAALLTALVVLVIVFTPLTFFGFQIFLEARDFYIQTNTGERSITQVVTDIGEERLNDLFPWLQINVSDYIRAAVEWLLGHVGPVFSSLAQLLLSLFLSLLALYYSLKDGHRLLRAIIHLSPLADRYDKQIIARLHTAVTSVIQGSLVIAILQGMSTALGFFLFGVPNPFLWGSIAVIAALVPSVGTALVIVPGVIYLFSTGALPEGLGLVFWGITAVGLIDNLLGPKLIQRGLRIHPFLILLAVIGGIGFFGPIGFLVGPLVLSLLFALLDIYPLLFPQPA